MSEHEEGNDSGSGGDAELPESPPQGGTAPTPPKRFYGTNPWWVPPIFGKVPPELTDKHMGLLGAVSMALFIEEYDLSMITAALRDIAKTLGMAETELGLYLGLIRLGAIPAFVVIPMADRVGRRRVFLWALALTGLATFATGFAQTPMQFVAAQMVARTFVVTGAALAFVMVTEEFPATRRGFGIGMVGALGATGHGLGVGLFSLIDVLHFSWRWLYFIGVLPVLALPLFAKAVPETARYEKMAKEREDQAPAGLFSWITPLVDLARNHPGRAFGIAVVGFVPAIGMISAFQFTGYYTQEVQGWSRSSYALMVIVGGAIGIGGNVVAGRLGDRYGRRMVGVVLLGLFPVFVTMFYRGTGWMIPVAWVLFLFASQGGRVVLRAMATELFPTSARSSASGLYNILETSGAATGLFLLYMRSEGEGDLARLTPYLSTMVAVGGMVLFFFPETRQRELESIS